MQRSKLFPWFVWGIVLSFFSFQFIYRLFQGLAMSQIMEKFQMSASDYGFLSSMYYFGYAGAQIPIAIFLDQYGPRKVVTSCILLCSIAAFIFSHTHHLSTLLMARFLMGIGSAAGFLGAAKVITQWFSRANYAKMIGFTFTFGLLGAVYGGEPVAFLIKKNNWEDVLTGLSYVGVGIAFFVLIFLRDAGPFLTHQAILKLSDIKCIIRNKAIVLLGVSNLLLVGPLEGFGDVWGVSYFIKSCQIQKTEAAFIVSFIFIGMLFGGPLLAFLTKKWCGFFNLTAACGVVSGLLFLILFICFFGANHYNIVFFSVVMFLVGIFCCYQVLIFSIGSQIVQSELLGITTAFLNCTNMLGGSFFHSTIGSLLDFVWSGDTRQGIRFYTAEEFRLALLIIPITSMIGSVVLRIVKKESKHSESYKST